MEYMISFMKGCYERNVDYFGSDLNDGPMTFTESEKECQQVCQKNSECVAFTWISPNMPKGNVQRRRCFIKRKKGNRIARQYVVSGPKDCGNIFALKYL